MKTITVIPARANSKRIPNKNLRLLAGYPLIVYSIETAKELGYPIFVTSDSELILKISSDWGAIPVLRPSEISTDTSTDIEWAGHLLEYYRKKEGEYPEQIIFLRPTTPLRTIDTVKRAIDGFKKEASSLRSVQPLAEAPEKAFREENGYLIPAMYNLLPIIGTHGIDCTDTDMTNLPNQTFPPAYTGNGYIDIIKPDVIIETHSLYGDKIQAFITEQTIDIDDLNDWKYAEYLLGDKHEGYKTKDRDTK